MSKVQSVKSEFVPQVRAVCLGNFVEVVSQLGVDPYPLLRKARIRPEDLGDGDVRLAASAVVRLAEDTVRATGCDALALLMVEPRNFASLGPISLLLQHRGTLRGAVESLVKHQRLLGDLMDYALDVEGDMATIRGDILPGYGSRQTVEFAIGLLFQTLRELSNGRWRPECIHFRHSAPADLRVHRRFYQCPVQFDSDFDGITCAAETLEIGNRAANEVMARHAEQCLELYAGPRPVATVAEQVRRAIFAMISRGNVTMDSVADKLSLHPRMLQRLLEKEGSTFAGLLNEIRRELAIRYLGTSNHSVTDVGLLLGYSTLSSFSRWFTMEFGKSPAVWRTAERGLPLFDRDYRRQPAPFENADPICA